MSNDPTGAIVIGVIGAIIAFCNHDTLKQRIQMSVFWFSLLFVIFYTIHVMRPKNETPFEQEQDYGRYS
jgi:hypothetical protein